MDNQAGPERMGDESGVGDGAPGSAAPNSFTLLDGLVVASDPQSVWAESIRALRSNLLSQHVKLGRRGLAVCSPGRDSGTSFVAANLAMSLAQAGVSTLLIDADLRAPSMQNYIRSSLERPGLNECLRDDSLSLASAITQVAPNLSILYAGQSDALSHDRLGSAQFRTMIGQCLRDFDLTIIDTPAANESADAKRIAAVVRHALIVTCRARSYVKDVEVLLEELANDGVQVIGTYLNDY